MVQDKLRPVSASASLSSKVSRPHLLPLLPPISSPLLGVSLTPNAARQAPTYVSQCLPILQGVKTPSPAPATPSSLGLLLGTSSTPRGHNGARQAPTCVSQCLPQSTTPHPPRCQDPISCPCYPPSPVHCWGSV